MEPALDSNKLRELLVGAHEHAALDYKRRLDLNDRQHLLEFVKDLAAMQAGGGYIVIGAHDDGRPSGELSIAEADLFDDSRLRNKVKRFLPDIELRTARHELDGAPVVLVYVAAHPNGFAIVAADGQVGEKTVFRQGEVFVRHGTASERWRPEDFPPIRERLLERAQGIPELVPAPPSSHRIDEPHVLRMSPVGGLFYQRVFIEVENVGPAIARVIQTTVSPYNAGGFAGVRAPAAIAPYSSRPFEINTHVADEEGLAAGADLGLRILYEGGGRRRELLMNARYNRSGGFENTGHNIWEA